MGKQLEETVFLILQLEKKRAHLYADREDFSREGETDDTEQTGQSVEQSLAVSERKWEFLMIPAGQMEPVAKLGPILPCAQGSSQTSKKMGPIPVMGNTELQASGAQNTQKAIDPDPSTVLAGPGRVIFYFQGVSYLQHACQRWHVHSLTMTLGLPAMLSAPPFPYCVWAPLATHQKS